VSVSPETPPSLAIKGQYVKSLTFKSPRRPGPVAIVDEAVTYSFEIDVDAIEVGVRTFEVSVAVHGEMRHETELRVLLKLAYGGIFVLNGLPAEAIEPTLYIVAPELLFPMIQRKMNRLLFNNGIMDRVGSFDFVELYHKRQGVNRPRPV
jgi:preprotein translocase subunit SecB